MDMKMLDTFGKRLGFLLDQKEIKKKDLADALNVSQSTISGYLIGRREPNFKILSEIADFLKVDANFLLLRSDDYKTHIKKEIDGDLFEITFDDEKLHLSQKDIEELFTKLKSVGFDVKKLL